MEKSKDRIARIMDLLGSEASELDARRVSAHLEEAMPGVAPEDMPPETWQWLSEGCGRPPVVCAVPPSATSLLGLYADMTETGRGKLVEHARAIQKAETELGFCDSVT